MIRVVVVTDIRLYRDGLVRHLAEQPQFEVVGSAAGTVEGIRCVEEVRPDIVLMDLTLPDCHAAVRTIGRVAPVTRVVVLAMPEEEQDLVACAEAGVAGFVPREASLAELVAAVQRAARDEVLVPPGAASALLRRVAVLAATATGPVGSALLTPRESEIALLIDEGKSNKEIAVGLGIEVATVKNHVHHILEKLKLHRRAEVPRMVRARARRPLLPVETKGPLGERSPA